MKPTTNARAGRPPKQAERKSPRMLAKTRPEAPTNLQKSLPESLGKSKTDVADKLSTFAMSNVRSQRQKCRYCGKLLDETSEDWRRFQPFCSKKCRLADLDCWFEEEYRISVKRREEKNTVVGGEADLANT